MIVNRETLSTGLLALKCFRGESMTSGIHRGERPRNDYNVWERRILCLYVVLVGYFRGGS